MGQQEQIINAVKSILSVLPNGKNPEVQQALVGLIQKHGPDKILPALTQAINEGKNDPNKLGEIEQAIVQSAQQEEQTQAQMAKLGAKINYLKKINGQCPEGFEAEKFKVGGTIKTKCKPCEDKAKKMEDGSKIEASKSKTIEEYKKERDAKNIITDKKKVADQLKENESVKISKLGYNKKEATVVSKQLGGKATQQTGIFGKASKMN